MKTPQHPAATLTSVFTYEKTETDSNAVNGKEAAEKVLSALIRQVLARTPSPSDQDRTP